MSRNLRGKGKTKIPDFKVGNSKITTNNEKAEILASTFIQANSLTYHYNHPSDQHITSIVNNFKREPRTVDRNY